MKKISLILAVVACLFVGCKQQNNSTSNKVQMKIASFNLRFDETMHKKFDDPKKADHWNARRAVIVPMMRYHGVDIFISQELFAHQIKQLEADGVYKAVEDFNLVATFMPQLKTGHNLPAERVFKDGLGEFDKKNFIAGRNRDYGDAVEYRMHNTIFYKPEKFEVLKQGSFFLSATPDKFSVGWDTMNTKASQMRRCFWVKFKEKNSGKEFFVFNTHTPSSRASEPERQKAAELIVKKIKEIAGDNTFFFGGDLNARPGSPSINYYHAQKGYMFDTKLVSKTAPYGPKGTFNLWGKTVKDRKADRIDFIFVSKDVSVFDYAVLSDTYYDVYPSDHFPITSRVEF